MYHELDRVERGIVERVCGALNRRDRKPTTVSRYAVVQIDG
jgi:hypothetical protein